MHALLSNLTAAAMLFHALLGCCWHHAHGSENCATIACVEHDHGHDNGSSDRDSEKQNGDSDEQDGQSCQGSTCVFLRADGPVVTSDLSTLGFTFILPVNGCTQADMLAVRSDYSKSHDLSPPSRLHLLHQILLI